MKYRTSSALLLYSLLFVLGERTPRLSQGYILTLQDNSTRRLSTTLHQDQVEEVFTVNNVRWRPEL